MLTAAQLKVVRDHTDRVRRTYVTVRRARAWFRDRVRRSAVADLPAPRLAIPPAAGYLLCRPGDLGGVDRLCEAAHAALGQYDPAGPARNRKRFLINVLDMRTLELESPFVQFALQPALVAAVSRYLGMVPLLTHISVFHSPPDTVPARSSQLYHCDAEEIRQVKVFVYCKAVEPANGPLTVLDATRSEQVRRRVGFRFHDHLTDEQVTAIVGPGAECPVVGPPGTAVLVDTSRCLHFGSRVSPEASARLMVMIQYGTPYSFLLPYNYRTAVPFRRLIGPGLDRASRLVLGG